MALSGQIFRREAMTRRRVPEAIVLAILPKAGMVGPGRRNYRGTLIIRRRAEQCAGEIIFTYWLHIEASKRHAFSGWISAKPVHSVCAGHAIAAVRSRVPVGHSSKVNRNSIRFGRLTGF